MRKVAIGFKVDQDVKDELEQLAKKNQRTLSDLTRIFVEHGLEKCRKAKEGNRAGLDLLYILGLSETSTNGGSNS